MAQIKGKQIKDNSLDPKKIKSGNLPTTVILGSDLSVANIDAAADSTLVTKKFVTDKIADVTGGDVSDLKTRMTTAEGEIDALQAADTAIIGDAADEYNSLGKIEDVIIANKTAIEGSLSTAISTEVTDRNTAIANEKTRAEGQEAAIRSEFAAADTALETSLKAYTDTEISTLETKVNNVISNTDPAALDSLTEIVAAFQTADSDMNSAISTLAENSSAAIATEKTRAEGIEEGLRTDLNAEITRATGIEDGLRTDLTAETTRATDAEAALQTAIDGINTEVSNVLHKTNTTDQTVNMADAKLTVNYADGAEIKMQKTGFSTWSVNTHTTGGDNIQVTKSSAVYAGSTPSEGVTMANPMYAADDVERAGLYSEFNTNNGGYSTADISAVAKVDNNYVKFEVYNWNNVSKVESKGVFEFTHTGAIFNSYENGVYQPVVKKKFVFEAETLNNQVSLELNGGTAAGMSDAVLYTGTLNLPADAAKTDALVYVNGIRVQLTEMAFFAPASWTSATPITSANAKPSTTNDRLWLNTNLIGYDIEASDVIQILFYV